jgi:hypothetical protein
MQIYGFSSIYRWISHDFPQDPWQVRQDHCPDDHQRSRRETSWIRCCYGCVSMCFPGVKDDESPKYEWVMQLYYWCFSQWKWAFPRASPAKKIGIESCNSFQEVAMSSGTVGLPGGLTPTDKTLFFGPVIGQVSVQEPVSVGWRAASPVISHRDDRRRWFWTGPTPSWTMCEGLPRGLPHRLIGVAMLGFEASHESLIL